MHRSRVAWRLLIASPTNIQFSVIRSNRHKKRYALVAIRECLGTGDRRDATTSSNTGAATYRTAPEVSLRAGGALECRGRSRECLNREIPLFEDDIR